MATLEAAEELKIIQELEDAGVNGMAVFPLDHPQIVSVLNDLIKKNIAVVTFNSRADSVNSNRFCIRSGANYTRISDCQDIV